MARFESFYLLDADDRLQAWGGPGWTRDATAGADLSRDSLYAHVAGHFTQRFLRAFFAEARAAPDVLTRRYRCDSPQSKRLYEMRAQPLGDGALRVEHWLIEEAPMAFAVETRETPALASHLRCSICNRLQRRGVRDWREPDAEPAPPAPLAVIHTVCEDCRSGLAARLPIRATSAGSTPPEAPPSSS